MRIHHLLLCHPVNSKQLTGSVALSGSFANETAVLEVDRPGVDTGTMQETP